MASELCRRFGALTGKMRIGITPRLPAATAAASQRSQENSDWPPLPPLQPPAAPRPAQRRPLSSLPVPSRLYHPAPPSVAARREWAPTPTAASRSSPAAAAVHHRGAAPLHPAERGVRAAPILLPGSVVDGVVVFQPRRAPAPTSLLACGAAAPPQPQAQLLLLAAPAKEPPPPSPRIRELPTHAPLTAPASGMPVGGTYADAAITVAHGAASDGGQAGDTTGHPPQPPVLPHGAGHRQAGKRRAGASSAPPVPCDLPGATHTAKRPRSAYASCRHAAVCAGPWVCALDRMPPLPPTGAKRARAGLADQPIDGDEQRAVKAQRAARALVAILPYASASFILHDPPALVAARSTEDNAERMVRCLSSFGLASLKGAYSAYGRLASWMLVSRPATTTISGSDVTDWYEAHPPSSATTASVVWLRDWCGLDLPARGAVARPFKGRPPSRTNAKGAFDIFILTRLEVVAALHPSPFVRGHAAGWILAMRSALRAEQFQSMVINAIVDHSFRGRTFPVISASVVRDKNPDPTKRRPRPFWTTVLGFTTAGAPLAALRDMLGGAEECKCLSLDTDSPSGDPHLASRWVLAPAAPHRLEASLASLLQLTGVDPAIAAGLRRHGAKRFLLCAADASPEFSAPDSNELGRFSRSSAQDSDLEPVAAMLRAHDMRCPVLPGIYSGVSRVSRTIDRVCRMHLVLAAAAARVDDGAASQGDASWGDAGPFAHPLPRE